MSETIDKPTYKKTILHTLESNIIVYDYTNLSYAIKSSKEWFNIPENSNKLKKILKNGKYNTGLKDENGEVFKGWVYGKKSNPIETIISVLNS